MIRYLQYMIKFIKLEFSLMIYILNLILFLQNYSYIIRNLLVKIYCKMKNNNKYYYFYFNKNNITYKLLNKNL